MTNRLKWRKAHDIINRMTAAIEAEYHVPVHVPVKEDPSRDISRRVMPDEKCGTGHIRVGMKRFRFAKLTGCAKEADVVRTVLSLQREGRHVEQENIWSKPAKAIDIEQTRRIARYGLTNRAVPEFYRATYFKNPVLRCPCFLRKSRGDRERKSVSLKGNSFMLLSPSCLIRARRLLPSESAGASIERGGEGKICLAIPVSVGGRRAHEISC